MVVLITYLFFTIFSDQKFCKDDRGSSINNYIELFIESERDTVYHNEVFNLTVSFKNKTDNTVYFYPKGTLTLFSKKNDTIETFGGSNSKVYYLRNHTDLRVLHELSPGEVYKETHRLPVLSSWLTSGKNNLYLYYRCSKQKGKNKQYNKLYGTLRAEKIIVYLKE